jgi:hypothetical protein
VIRFKDNDLVADCEGVPIVVSSELLRRADVERGYRVDARKVAANHADSLPSLFFNFLLTPHLFVSLPPLGFGTGFG